MFSSPKSFSTDIEILFNKLKSGDKFSFGKFADGEYSILKGLPIDNGEFVFDAVSDLELEARDKLIDSFLAKEEGYYIGISCPCCAGQDAYDMRNLVKREDKDITFANIFVNSNYGFYVENFIPEYKNHKILLVANQNSNFKNLTFNIDYTMKVGHSAYINYEGYIDWMNRVVEDGDWLVLMACGPLGNILAYEGWKTNKNNVYLDIGSTLNPWLQSEGFKRHYYEGDNHYSRLVCRW
jgi:hypothetical protein